MASGIVPHKYVARRFAHGYVCVMSTTPSDPILLLATIMAPVNAAQAEVDAATQRLDAALREAHQKLADAGWRMNGVQVPLIQPRVKRADDPDTDPDPDDTSTAQRVLDFVTSQYAAEAKAVPTDATLHGIFGANYTDKNEKTVRSALSRFSRDGGPLCRVGRGLYIPASARLAPGRGVVDPDAEEDVP